MNTKTAIVFAPTEPSREAAKTLENIRTNRSNWSFLVLSGDSRWELANSDRVIVEENENHIRKLEELSEIAAVYFIEEGEQIIPIEILTQTLSGSIPELLTIRRDGAIEKYRLKESGREKVLFIFPGPILPLTLGSHQRAFNLLINLKNAGFDTEALITAGTQKNAAKAADALKALCSNVHTYKNNRRKFKRGWRILRWIEQRLLQRETPAHLPDLFTERAFTKPTESLKITVSRLLKSQNYKAIIVSYAWMVDCLQYADTKGTKIICDTHDVQYLRNKSIKDNKSRLLYFANREKKAEIERLKKMDLVLGISERDTKELKKAIPPEKVICTPAGFNYAIRPIKKRNANTPLKFGFIGGKMDANQLSLQHIIEKWLPSIREYSPESKFFIAGTVCNTPIAERAAFLDENVILLGVVPSIGKFYDSIDIALNPALIKGGLNFKSIEALMAGKHLITNAIGYECLGDAIECTICDFGEDVVRFLREIEFDIELDFKIRTDRQKRCIQSYSNRRTHSSLLSHLNT